MSLGAMLDLQCPLVGLDLETTGLFPRVDRIVQIALIKLWPDGRTTEFCSLVNPEVPIPPEATRAHGITDDVVRERPTFAQLAPRVLQELEWCDIAGYNVRFDLAVLSSELVRAGHARPALAGRVLDACRIFRLMEPRSLSAAARFYLDEEHTGAHDARADVLMTLRVLEQQLQRYAELPRTVGGLDTLLNAPKEDWVDPDGKLVWRYGEAAVAIGPHAGRRLRLVPRSFLKWMLRKDFGDVVKAAVKDALDGKYWTRDSRP